MAAARGSQGSVLDILYFRRSGRVSDDVPRTTTDAESSASGKGNMEADYIYTSGSRGGEVLRRPSRRGSAPRIPLHRMRLRLLCLPTLLRGLFSPSSQTQSRSPARAASRGVRRPRHRGVRLSHPQVWAFVTFRGIRGVGPPLLIPRTGRETASRPPKLKPKGDRVGAITDIEGFEPGRFLILKIGRWLITPFLAIARIMLRKRRWNPRRRRSN